MIIYFVGISGVGKTTIAKQLSAQFNYQLIDLDSSIEAVTNLSITEIFKTFGEEYFRKIERKELHKTFSLQNCIIATGGGTPCFFDNMEVMSQNGKTVYLKLSPSTIYNRFSEEDKLTRPLLKKGKENFIKLFEEREFYYQQASVQIDLDKEDYAMVISELVSPKA